MVPGVYKAQCLSEELSELWGFIRVSCVVFVLPFVAFESCGVLCCCVLVFPEMESAE